MPTTQELELKRQREERLQEDADRDAHPLLARIRAIDEGVREALHILPFIASGALILYTLGLTWYAVLLAAYVVFDRENVLRLLGWIWKLTSSGVVAVREAARNRATSEAKAREKELRESVTDPDTFDAVPIPVIAEKISAEANGIASRTLLESLGIRTKKVRELQGILMNARFLVYPFSFRKDARPLGDELVAYKEPSNYLATTIHPTLMTLNAGDRALHIANAIRRAVGVPEQEVPRVHGELSENGRALVGLKGAHGPET